MCVEDFRMMNNNMREAASVHPEERLLKAQRDISDIKSALSAWQMQLERREARVTSKINATKDQFNETANSFNGVTIRLQQQITDLEKSLNQKANEGQKFAEAFQKELKNLSGKLEFWVKELLGTTDPLAGREKILARLDALAVDHQRFSTFVIERLNQVNKRVDVVGDDLDHKTDETHARLDHLEKGTSPKPKPGDDIVLGMYRVRFGHDPDEHVAMLEIYVKSLTDLITSLRARINANN